MEYGKTRPFTRTDRPCSAAPGSRGSLGSRARRPQTCHDEPGGQTQGHQEIGREEGSGGKKREREDGNGGGGYESWSSWRLRALTKCGGACRGTGRPEGAVL